MILEGLHRLSIKLVDEMRFAEADVVDQAMARIIELPRAITKMEHAWGETWNNDWNQIIEFMFGKGDR